MRWPPWILAVLMPVRAGCMTFDGGRTFVVGDSVTPRSGLHAGQLGVWPKRVQAIAIQPRSGLMKSIHVAGGAIPLPAWACVLAGFAWGPRAVLMVAAAGSCWLPIGALLNLVVIVLLSVTKPGAIA